MMFKKLLMVMAVAMGLVIASGSKIVSAAGLTFAPTPVMPASQRDKSESFFDLVVKPGATESIRVQLKNTTNKTQTLKVKVAPAQTNANGLVVYDGSQSADKTLKYNLQDLISGPKQVTLAAGATVMYKATLTMPTAHFAGIIAGGVTFTPAEKADQAASQAMTVKNVFNYTVAVLARQHDTTWQPKLKVGKAVITRTAGQNLLKVRFNNVSNTFLNQLEVNAQATRPGAKTVKRAQKAMQMAPNSHFDYQIRLPAKVSAGKYLVRATAYYYADTDGKYTDNSGKHFRYEQKYTATAILTASEVNRINATAKTERGTMPLSQKLKYVAAVVAVLVVLGLIWFGLRRRRRKSDKRIAELEAKVKDMSGNNQQ